MKSKKTIIGLATAMAMTASAIPYSVSAEETTVYGLMNIPYSEFYAAEFGNSSNAYEVDAFSSATTSKWSKNGAGELFEGTFNQPNDDGTGKILGVTYPVAITQTDLDALGSENYNFTPLDSEPTAYKNVSISNGSAKFSAVQDSTPTTASEASIKLSTNTPWGDYLIDVENKPEIGAIYGALIKTADGKTYAMRHEENIWRGELAWSSGINLPDVNGFAVCSKLREKADTPILIVSARTDKEDKLSGFDLGADDYIDKPYDIDILIAKIKGIFKRRYQREILSADGVTLNLADRTAVIDGVPVDLPTKEFNMLTLLIENQGKVLKKEYLFSTVWGSDSESELQTLHVHINRLRQKLGDDPKNARRLLTVWGVGYKFV